MSTLTDGPYEGEFLVSELPGTQSREVITLKSGAGVVLTSTILGKITASGKYVPVDLAANDGSQTAAAILWTTRDATSADVTNAVGIVRGAEVNGAEVIYPAGATDNQKAGIRATLAGLGILVRNAVAGTP